jgi:hypothetical protein
MRCPSHHQHQQQKQKKNRDGKTVCWGVGGWEGVSFGDGTRVVSRNIDWFLMMLSLNEEEKGGKKSHEIRSLCQFLVLSFALDRIGGERKLAEGAITNFGQVFDEWQNAETVRFDLWSNHVEAFIRKKVPMQWNQIFEIDMNGS